MIVSKSKKFHYEKAINLAKVLDDYILEIAQMNDFKSDTPETKKIAKAYALIQDLQTVLDTAQKKPDMAMNKRLDDNKNLRRLFDGKTH